MCVTNLEACVCVCVVSNQICAQFLIVNMCVCVCVWGLFVIEYKVKGTQGRGGEGGAVVN